MTELGAAEEHARAEKAATGSAAGATAYVSAERLAATLIELIDTPSPTGGEQALAELLRERFAGLGLRSWLQEVEPGESNVVARLQGSGGGATLLFVGHLDTTWSGAEEGIYERGAGFQPRARREGDWIYGMGAYNMKCGIATAVEAIQALVDSGVGLRGDVVFAGVVGESPKAQVGRFQGAAYRGAGKGARHLVTNGVVADCCVIPESTSGQISIASGGYLFAELVTHANPIATYRRSRSDERAVEPDAIEQMNLVLDQVRRWGKSYAGRFNDDGVPTHVSVVSVEGGIPYRPTKQAPICRAMVEIGVRPGQPLVNLIDELRDVVRRAEVQCELNVVQSVPGADVPPDEFVVRALSAAHAREFGEEPALTTDGWLADTTHLTRYGIPAVCYGTGGRMRAGGYGYYAPDGEQCYLPDLVRGARVFVNLAGEVAGRLRAKVEAIDPGRSRGTIVL